MEVTIEKRREYQKRWLDKNPDYFKEYYQNHKQRILDNHKKWLEEKAIDSIYCFVNTDGNVLYAGSSARFQERISSHCTKHSHLKMSAEEMVMEWGLDKIMYQDYSEYNLSRHDLYYIESQFKLKNKELIKTAEVHFDENKLTRSKNELELLSDSLEFIEFEKLERYLN